MPRGNSNKHNGQNNVNNTNSKKNNDKDIQQNSQITPQTELSNLTDTFRQTREILYEQFPQTGTSGPETTYQQNFQTIPNRMDLNQGQERGHVYYSTAQANTTPVQTQYNQSCFYPPNPIQQPNIAHPSQDNGIPPWAASLCQQMTTIQSTLNGQTQRWQSVERQITNQNVELVKMQTQLSEITHIKQNLEKTNAKLITVQDEVKTMRSTTREYDQTMRQNSDLYDEQVINYSNTDQRLHKIESKLNTLERNQAETVTQIEHTNDRVTDLQWRSMRENLLFCGIQEVQNFREEGENCEQEVKEFIREALNIESEIKLDRCHRLGRFKRDNLRPRPIVAKFTYFKDKERVKKAGQQLLKDSDFWIKDQYPKDMEEKRKTLYPVADEARKNTENKVNLVKDRLYINGKQYIPETPSGQQQQQYQQHQHQQYQHQQQRQPQNRSFGRNWPAIRRYNNVDNRNAPQGSRTFYRTPAPTPQPTLPDQTDVLPLSNRFTALASETPENRPNRSQLAGKNKATSPLEDSNTFKKQNRRTSDSQSDSDSEQSDILIQTDAQMIDSQASTQEPEVLQAEEADNSFRATLLPNASRDTEADGPMSCDQALGNDVSRDRADDLIRARTTEVTRDHTSLDTEEGSEA